MAPPQAQRYITQLKSQINSLEAELEEQRAQKQRALVENEQLRMELEATRRRNSEHESLQTTFLEAESKTCGLLLCCTLYRYAANNKAVVSLCRKIAGHGAEVQQAEGEAHRAGGQPCRAAAEGRDNLQRFLFLIKRWHLAAGGDTNGINLVTECRHCEDAVSHPADPGGGGADQTAAVI